MRTVEELLDEAKKLPVKARKELRDRLAESLEVEKPCPEPSEEGPYASLLRSAGSAHSTARNVSRNKNKHLAEIYAPKRAGR
jgi:hypothetical protein